MQMLLSEIKRKLRNREAIDAIIHEAMNLELMTRMQSDPDAVLSDEERASIARAVHVIQAMRLYAINRYFEVMDPANPRDMQEPRDLNETQNAIIHTDERVITTYQSLADAISSWLVIDAEDIDSADPTILAGIVSSLQAEVQRLRENNIPGLEDMREFMQLLASDPRQQVEAQNIIDELTRLIDLARQNATRISSLAEAVEAKIQDLQNKKATCERHFTTLSAGKINCVRAQAQLRSARDTQQRYLDQLTSIIGTESFERNAGETDQQFERRRISYFLNKMTKNTSETDQEFQMRKLAFPRLFRWLIEQSSLSQANVTAAEEALARAIADFDTTVTAAREDGLNGILRSIAEQIEIARLDIVAVETARHEEEMVPVDASRRAHVSAGVSQRSVAQQADDEQVQAAILASLTSESVATDDADPDLQAALEASRLEQADEPFTARDSCEIGGVLDPLVSFHVNVDRVDNPTAKQNPRDLSAYFVGIALTLAVTVGFSAICLLVFHLPLLNIFIIDLGILATGVVVTSLLGVTASQPGSSIEELPDVDDGARSVSAARSEVGSEPEFAHERVLSPRRAAVSHLRAADRRATGERQEPTHEVSARHSWR